MNAMARNAAGALLAAGGLCMAAQAPHLHASFADQFYDQAAAGVPAFLVLFVSVTGGASLISLILAFVMRSRLMIHYLVPIAVNVMSVVVILREYDKGGERLGVFDVGCYWCIIVVPYCALLTFLVPAIVRHPGRKNYATGIVAIMVFAALFIFGTWVAVEY